MPAPAAARVCLARSAIPAISTTRRDHRPARISNSTRKAGGISDRGWQREFDDPIPLTRGRPLVTLADARAYIFKLKKADQDSVAWQAAIEALLLVANRDGPTMFARIGVMRALNRHVERVFNPERKDTHWGKRKLKRDL
jgi:hypothetical protein